MLVHNILVRRAQRNTWTLSVNNCKEITQLTTFPAKIKLSTTNQAQCFQILSLNNSRFFHINHHTYANIPLLYVFRSKRLVYIRDLEYDAFPSQAQDQCFTRLAKMRRNTVTYWTTADFANRQETCSLIRLNDAFRKTLLQAAKKKSRKSTDHEKKIFRARWFQIGLFNHTDRSLGNDRDRRWGEGKMYKAASLAHESVMSAGAPHMPV